MHPLPQKCQILKRKSDKKQVKNLYAYFWLFYFRRIPRAFCLSQVVVAKISGNFARSSCISGNFVSYWQGFVVILRNELRDLGTSQDGVGVTGYPAFMEVNEKELRVPTLQSGWSRIQVGMGQKQGKRCGGREKQFSMEGGDWGGWGSAWGTVPQTLGHNALKFGVTTPQNWGSYCPMLLGLIVPKIGFTLLPILRSKCAKIEG